nr:putative calcium-transporting ATPase 13, plasma membrane-type [Ziziphus jujuba var. spinosa]
MEFPDTNFRILARKTRSGASGKKVSGVLIGKIGDNEERNILHLHYKGAASTILKMCSNFYDTKGKRHDMNNISQKRLMFEKVIEDMEHNGLRPFAFACGQTDIEEIKEDTGLDLLAIIGLKYHCQNEIKSEMEALRKAGVTIKMVSDDELPAVKAIAWELGLFSSQSSNINVAMEGQEIREMTESSSRIEKVNQTTVMGNCLPNNKFLMVEDLKKNGHVVAFYGSLTARDAPALKSCDIVITENFRCTEMARELSDISINDMSSLSLIFKYGRCAYHNIQKFFQLQLTALISPLIISFAFTIHSGDSPLTGLQLIWTNLIIYLLGGFMMVMNLEGNVLPSLGEQGVRKTMIFDTFILCQIFNHFNVIDLVKKEVLKVVFHKYYCFLVALGTVMVMHILIVEVGKDVASCVRLNAVQWTFGFLLAAFSWGFDWAMKQVLASLQSYI